MSQENFAAPAPVADSPDPGTYVSQLVGEGKKYATVEDLAKGALHAQAHIETIELERAEARTVEQVLQQLDQRKQEQILSTPVAPVSPVEPTAPSDAPKEVNLEEQVLELLERREREKSKESNYASAVTRLDEVYGSREKTNEAVAKRAAELGVGVEFLKAAAEASPKAFFAQMGLERSQTPVRTSPTPNTVNPGVLQTTLATSAAREGTQAWYRELQRSDPKKYRSKAIQRKMMEDLERDPAAFMQS